jgi:hypothetical protein
MAVLFVVLTTLRKNEPSTVGFDNRMIPPSASMLWACQFAQIRRGAEISLR